MYERDDDFHKYVSMAEKSPSEMLALIAREQDDSRERRETYRDMDDERHNVLVNRFDVHSNDPDAHHPAPKGKNGGKVIVNVGKKNGESNGKDTVKMPAKVFKWLIVAIIAVATGTGVASQYGILPNGG